MIYCVSLNPTIDKTVRVDGFQIGATNRALDVRESAGGKAVNVAIVLKELGKDPRVLGVNSRMDGEILREALESHSIFYDFHDLDAPARVNLKVIDITTKTVTEVNDPGIEVGSDLLSRIADELVETPDSGEAVVLAGKLPPKAPDTWYADVVERLKAKDVRAIVDTSGEALKAAVKKGPWMIKPNAAELSELLGREVKTLGDVEKASSELIDQYKISVVLVSLGSKGMYLATTDSSLYAPGITVDVKNTVGAGDSAVAGAIAFMDGTLDDMLRAGVAAATGSVSSDGLCTRQAFDTYFNEAAIAEEPDGTIRIVEE